MGAGLGSNPSANVALGALDWSMGMGAPQQAQPAQQQQAQYGGMGGFGAGGGGAVNPFASPQAAPGGGGAFGSHDPFAAPQQQQQQQKPNQGLSFNPFE